VLGVCVSNDRGKIPQPHVQADEKGIPPALEKGGVCEKRESKGPRRPLHRREREMSCLLVVDLHMEGKAEGTLGGGGRTTGDRFVDAMGGFLDIRASQEKDMQKEKGRMLVIWVDEVGGLLVERGEMLCAREYAYKGCLSKELRGILGGEEKNKNAHSQEFHGA